MTKSVDSIERDLPHIPDNLTVAQFMLDYKHPLRPPRAGIPCLVEDRTGRKITLKELREDTYALSTALQSIYHLDENGVVVIFSPNHVGYPVALWAVHRLGGIVSCSNPQFTTGELVYQLRATKPVLLIGHSTNIKTAISAAAIAGLPSDRVITLDHLPHELAKMPSIRDLIEAGKEHDPIFVDRTLAPGEGKTKTALLSWSSGTTGKPKAVALSHYGLIANIIQMACHNEIDVASATHDARPYRPGDVASGVLPLYHVAGLVINLHLVVFCGLTIVLSERYSLPTLLENIACHHVNHLLLVPPQAIDLCKHPAVGNYDLSAIKYLMIGAAPVAKEVQEQLFELFPSAQIGQAYGEWLTEMTTTLAMIAGNQRRGPPGSGGRLLPGVQARVIKADGAIANYGEQGELWVKAPSQSLGYLNDEQATREVFVDGWVRTGDQVAMTSSREIFVIDRLKELLKVKGFQVAPAELEGCLLTHPDVADCCVVGVQDDYCGEVPRAYVVLTSEASQKSKESIRAMEEIKQGIIRHIADRKIGYKQLKGGVQIVDCIPKNGSGKLLRRVLRDQARDAAKMRARL